MQTLLRAAVDSFVYISVFLAKQFFYRQCVHIHKMEKYGQNQMLYFIMILLKFFSRTLD